MYAENGRFEIADDGVDPQYVPQRTTRDGMTIPAIGLGTFGSDYVSTADVARAVIGAAEVGYRHFDCASVYGNEKHIGQSLKIIRKCGVRRDQLHITSKVWNDRHDAVAESCRQSLGDLGLDYLDLYLVHWPFPNHHPPSCDAGSRAPNARPYIHEDFMKTWAQMEKLVDDGLVRAIGTSNVSIAKLKRILNDARILPAVNEMELHPHFQQPELFDFVCSHKIVPVGYSPVGSPARPDRDRSQTDTVDIEDPVVLRIAERLDVHPAVVCIKWGVQRGQIPIPFSTKRSNYLANIRAVVEKPLSDDEMASLASADRDCRLIKGQVFLWRQGQDWKDLWDENGTIAG